MYNRSQRESFVIQVKDIKQHPCSQNPPEPAHSGSSLKFNFSSMKIFNRFRRILMGFVFPFPSSTSHRSSRRTACESSFPRRSSCDRSEAPKTSCSSSYYSSNSHYDEAISDCIEFFNKSSQEDVFDAKFSDLMV
ncbi:hypothetical protein POM88_046782 [Heracleum sosnowskyi]|uniref:Uncharacterized protein n=1 Tax=Heracleum sosnowskyi TaxID=360622 RepID=A0AAD8H9T7_9APIA|nr:hypothetical protein POM88_046782 [Heracleum sosnowskyi]